MITNKAIALMGLALVLCFSTVGAQEPLDFGDDTSWWANDGECDDPRFIGEGMATTMDDADTFGDATDCRRLFEQGLIRLRDQASLGAESANSRVERGRLETGDRTLSSGEYMDIYTYHGIVGIDFVVELRSQEFDPFLILRAPYKEQYENDDYEGKSDHSLIAHTPRVSGEYEIVVTSYRPSETGTYTLSIRSEDGQRVDLEVDERGTLDSGDNVLSSGEYADVYEFEGAVGQRVNISLSSTDFDAYLVLLGPQGFRMENDDESETASNSSIQADLTRSGTYRVIMTSFRPGERGAYQLGIQGTQLGDAVSSSDRFDVERLFHGVTAQGRLEIRDDWMDGERYVDLYSFDAEEGQEIRIDLRSGEFDAVLLLETPNGEAHVNDDYNHDRNRSVIELVAPEYGRYRVGVTSYRPADTGEYSVSLSLMERVDSRLASSVDTTPSSSGNVYGVFVGISDYRDDYQDLMYTAEDAQSIYDTLVESEIMREDDGVVLLDSRATRSNFEDATREIAERASGDDLIVLFFSGHGGQKIPESMSNRERGDDPDGIDETLVLYDSEMSDNEFRDLLLATKGDASVLVVLDACFSGGFQKDISAPGVMGVFSSEEFATSAVAAKFRAGGYLARFFADAVGNFAADANNDNVLEAFELRHYIGMRYDEDVRQDKNSSDLGNVVRSSENLGYQRLVVDLGSFRPDDALFVRE